MRISSIYPLKALVFVFSLWAPTMADGADLCTAGTSTGTADCWLHAVRLGAMTHDVDGLWSGFDRESGTDFNAEVIFARPFLQILGGTLLPNMGVTVNDTGDTSKLYGGLLWEIESDPGSDFGVFFNVGVGAAVHDGKLDTGRRDRKSLGSRVLFRIPIEVGVRVAEHHQLSLMFSHVSNAYLASPNEGLDVIGLRYGFRF